VALGCCLYEAGCGGLLLWAELADCLCCVGACVLELVDGLLSELADGFLLCEGVLVVGFLLQ